VVHLPVFRFLVWSSPCRYCPLPMRAPPLRQYGETVYTPTLSENCRMRNLDETLIPRPQVLSIPQPVHPEPIVPPIPGSHLKSGTSVVIMADRTSLPASDVEHRGIHHWTLGVGAAI
jgi:hypothetical protein